MKKLTLVLAALAGVVATGAQAQTYPARPITMIVPFAAGGPTLPGELLKPCPPEDIIDRAVAVVSPNVEAAVFFLR